MFLTLSSPPSQIVQLCTTGQQLAIMYFAWELTFPPYDAKLKLSCNSLVCQMHRQGIEMREWLTKEVSHMNNTHRNIDYAFIDRRLFGSAMDIVCRTIVTQFIKNYLNSNKQYTCIWWIDKGKTWPHFNTLLTEPRQEVAHQHNTICSKFPSQTYSDSICINWDLQFMLSRRKSPTRWLFTIHLV